MKIFASIKSYSNFKNIVSYADGILIPTKFTSTKIIDLSIDDIINIIKDSSSLNKMVCLDITTMLTNKDMNDLLEYINIFKDFDVFFIYGDIGVHTLLKSLNIENKGIFDPKTLITNSEDLNLYLDTGMNACSLSLEIPLSDIDIILSKKRGNVWYKVFGYHQMFHSKRNLISTYFKFLDKEISLNNKNSYLKEETRDDLYRIIENEHGTTLFRSYIINMLKEIDIIKKCDYIFLDQLFINEEIFIKILNVYNNVLSNDLTKEEGLKIIENLNLDIKDGFMYNDTVYVKEVGR